MVKCFRCNTLVEKGSAIILRSVSKKPRYSCYGCYVKQKRFTWGFGDEIPVKKELFCERCKYKFTSKRPGCPFCSKSDRVIESNITVKDLL